MADKLLFFFVDQEEMRHTFPEGTIQKATYAICEGYDDLAILILMFKDSSRNYVVNRRVAQAFCMQIKSHQPS